MEQTNAVRSLDRVLHVFNQAFDIGCGRITGIDNEVRVFRRHLGPAQAVAFQSGCFDEPRRMLARRVTEH